MKYIVAIKDAEIFTFKTWKDACFFCIDIAKKYPDRQFALAEVK